VLSGPESLPVRVRIAEVATVAVARAGEVQELIPCTQREGMCCRALSEGACVAWHPECLFYTCIAVSQGEWIGDCSKELGKKAAEHGVRVSHKASD